MVIIFAVQISIWYLKETSMSNKKHGTQCQVNISTQNLCNWTIVFTSWWIVIPCAIFSTSQNMLTSESQSRFTTKGALCAFWYRPEKQKLMKIMFSSLN